MRDGRTWKALGLMVATVLGFAFILFCVPGCLLDDLAADPCPPCECSVEDCWDSIEGLFDGDE